MNMAAVKLQKSVVSQTGKHTASVIFLHGSGDTGPGLLSWVADILGQNLAFENIRVIYPTAPSRPYTPMRGALSHVWFDRHKISQDCPEHLESIDSMCDHLGAIVQDEIRAGIPKHRMVIGGFSMGGAMALHLVSRYQPDVAGIFALSSFLNKDSVVYQAVENATQRPLPELLQCHGTADELVFHSWGKETNSLLEKAGLNTSFHSFPDLNHQLCRQELELLRSWILKKLSP
ncbi:lysophospholipase-like protein 1 [Pimephales promelas]|uniref:lysophospholipase-like protein 1 n=1 Tax=Pimephales promelas TaxID=90988 RepID=UPI0019559ECA|nr:lysophospholipase-like protein 1 [Pimephales promelas]KAG1936160.1 lysophospholipase-like protein [Pimephales promelas]